MRTIVERIDDLLTELGNIDDPQASDEALEIRSRIRGPLRVAVAGQMKAGKSTLINALVGSAIAATDATECTQVVTFYQFGETEKAVAILRSGDRSEVPYWRGDHNARIDLTGLDSEQIIRIEVDLDYEILRNLTIIDTPGTASLSQQISSHSMNYLLPRDRDADADFAPDVVVYLLRYLHEQDVDLLEVFGDVGPAGSDPLRALGVLSRSDEVGSGRGDAMALASELAKRVGDEPVVSAAVSKVHPVAGLLAFAASTLTSSDYSSLQAVGELPEPISDGLLRSARCFSRVDGRVRVSPQERALLVDRLGLVGLRFALAQIAFGQVTSLEELRSALQREGGMDPILDTIAHRFADRADVLRAGRAVGAIESLAESIQSDTIRSHVLSQLEVVRSNAHELDELEQLRELQLDPGARIKAADRAFVVRALGGNGTSPDARLGRTNPGGQAHTDMEAECLRQLAAMAHLRCGQGVARRARDAARRSLEQLHFQLAAEG